MPIPVAVIEIVPSLKPLQETFVLVSRDMVTSIPVPCIAKLYGFSFASLLSIITSAVASPETDGLNSITKDEFPPAAIVADGCETTEKSAAPIPLKETVGTPDKIKSAVPLLTIENVLRHLTKERIAFKLEYGTLSNGYTSAAIQIIASDVKLSFALPENDEEDYEQYLDRLKSADSNLFQLFSFSLMTK